jgi:hypothetical protein
MKRTKQYYYHISFDDLGDRVLLRPTANHSNRAEDEPVAYRLCVSATIQGCLRAIDYPSIFLEGGLFVYRSENRLLAREPYRVEDAEYTGEMWIVRPAAFALVGLLKTNDWPASPARALGDEKRTMELRELFDSFMANYKLDVLMKEELKNYLIARSTPDADKYILARSIWAYEGTQLSPRLLNHPN